jgi:hypothetical protein
MSNRIRVFLILLGALCVAATFTFPQWQPYLLQPEEADTVEVLSGVQPELQPTFEALPVAQQDTYRRLAAENQNAATLMINTALGPPTVVPNEEQALPSMSGPVIVARGAFTAVDEVRNASGNVIIYQQADNSKVVRFEEFVAVNGPDLRVMLTAKTLDQLTADPSLGITDVDLGPLRGTQGNQNYSLPPEINVSSYTRVVIVSNSLNIVYSIAPIQTN